MQDDTDERQKLYAETRSDLLKRQLSNSENFDRSVLSLSSALLAASIAFIRPSGPDAIDLAVAQDPDGAESYRLAGLGAEVDTELQPAPMLSLSVRPGESFDSLVARYSSEKNVSLREAIREVGKARPDLAAAR